MYFIRYHTNKTQHNILISKVAMVAENKQQQQLHIVLVIFPAQGHINPALQFAKLLFRNGVHVTITTSLSAHRRILSNNTTTPSEGLTFAPFSDGYDDGYKNKDDVWGFLTEFKRRGAESLSKLVTDLANEGRPVTCIIYTPLLAWVADVAHNLQVPSFLLWIQPAAVFVIYHYYFNGYREAISENLSDPSYMIELPGLPTLAPRDLPSFMLPSSPNAYSFALRAFEEQLEMLERERGSKQGNPLKILVNTFDDLEHDALKAVGDKYNLVGIGPMLPSAYLDCKDPSDTSFGGDLFNGSKDNDYIEWLNSKKKSSVVYVSFGSIAVLEKKQMVEIARALVESKRPFMWVIRKGEEEEDKEEDEVVLSLKQDKNQGLIVPWCSQVEVLNHPSVGCFVTHCGWNSTLESVVAGVPVVAFPQWTDQGTNAKLIEDVWKTGARVKVNEDDNMVESEEIKRCLERVMDGEEGEEMRKNAKKWKELSRKAAAEGGSSDKNLKSFLEEIGPVHF